MTTSKTPMFEGHEPHPESRQWTRGVCYHDGSSLAFDRIKGSFDSPECILDELAVWADGHLVELGMTDYCLKHSSKERQRRIAQPLTRRDRRDRLNRDHLGTRAPPQP